MRGVRLGVLAALVAAGTTAVVWTASFASAATVRWTVDNLGAASANLTVTGVAAIANNDIFAVGSRSTGGGEIYHSDGHRWERELLQLPSGSTLAGISAGPGHELWAVGRQVTGGIEAPLAVHLVHHRWVTVPTPAITAPSAFTAVSVRSAKDAWAVGVRQGDYGPHPLVEHWDGTAWTVVPAAEDTGNDGNPLYAVAALSPTDVWAVGGQEKGFVHPLAEHWDGHAWHLVPVPDLAPGVSDDTALRGIVALSARDVWAVGGGGLVVHWNGTAWSAVPSHVPASDPAAGLTFTGVAAHGSKDLWAVGTTGSRALTVHWDGTRWTNQPAPPGNALLGVGTTGSGRTYVVGWRTTGGSRSALVAHTG